MIRKITLSVLFLLIATTAVWADRGGFTYSYWSMKADVSANACWTVEECQVVDFQEPRHGIYRYLPLGYYTALNSAPEGQPEQKPTRHYRVDIDVTNTWGAETDISYDENDNCVIRFGNPDYEVSGQQVYGLNYTYRYHDDRITERDFIYHTLKPADIAEPVDSFYFELHFAKPLPADIAQRLHIYTGQWGSRSEADSVAGLIVSPTLISGKLYHLQPQQAVTLYAELPQGYWEDTESVSPKPALYMAILAIILGLVLLYLELFSRKAEPTTSVEFYAPDGITPTEVGKIIDNQTDIIDLTSLVPWLAEKGYLRITEIEGGALELRKLRSLPADAPDYQQRIVEMLFPNHSNTQRMDQLGEHPDKVEAAIKALDANFSGDKKLIEPHYTWLLWTLCVVSTLALTCNSLVEVCEFNTVIVAFCGWAMTYFCAILIRLFNSPKDPFRSRQTIRWIFGCRFVCFAVGFVLMLYFFRDTADLPIPAPILITMLALCYITCELAGRLNHDTDYRLSLKGRLRGFREFIETADKDRLKMLVDRDPVYFYKVLPYAILFDLSDKWVKQFTEIGVAPVDWYRTSGSPDSFSYINGLKSNISNDINHAITTASHNSSSSGSSFGGGGFSGGGGGGGGGGSW